MGVRKIGVEEEFLLVDARGMPQPLGEVVVAVARELEAENDQAGEGDGGALGGIEHELQLEQAEIATPPTNDAAELAELVLERRTTLATA